MLVLRQLTDLACPATPGALIARRLIRLRPRRNSLPAGRRITRVSDVHGPVGDRREHTVSIMGHVNRVVAAKRHAFDAVRMLDCLQQ